LIRTDGFFTIPAVCHVIGHGLTLTRFWFSIFYRM